MNEFIKIKNITKSFGEKIVLDDINFSIKRGAFTVLLGPSGCGKTTLLRIISGLEEPTSGEVIINNKIVNKLEPSKRDISMVFQSYALFPHLNIKENIIFGLKVRKVKKDEIENKLYKVAKLLGLDQLLDKKPAQLSGGQKQRVALARSFVSNHPICLMDEPLSNLDAKLRQEMRIEIKELQKRLELTVLYVTHDQTEAMSMADKIILLNSGKIEQEGTPRQLYDETASIFVGSFIGTPPMNIIKPQNKEETHELLSKIDITINESYLKSLSYIGIRPEEIEIDQRGIKCRVLFYDYHGADTIVGIVPKDFSFKNPLLVKTDKSFSFKVGEEVGISWNTKDMKIFDNNGKKIDFKE